MSALGYGCMRLPRNGMNFKQEACEKLLIQAIEAGVNYFDTAYIYGRNEVMLGKFLAKGWRSKVKLATKLPHFMVKSEADFDKLLNSQLDRLQTDYIDYYMVHMLPDMGVFHKLLELGFVEWVQEKKRGGQIINLGFSFHGAGGQFIQLVDAYDWDFCMIQYNYLDEYNQAGTAGLKHAAAKGLPVMVMEPLRGGKLAGSLPMEAVQLFEEAKPRQSPAQWALRWVWNHPEVTLLLSGMNDEKQLEENLQTVEDALPDTMDSQALQVIDQARAIIQSQTKVPCTACGYCMPCPAGVDIPACFASYNDKYALKHKRHWMYHMQNTGAASLYPAHASLCKNCGVCMKHCPQAIDIPAMLGQVRKEVETPFFNLACAVTKRVMGGKNRHQNI